VHRCHYCGARQPRRRLRRIELSGLGVVGVCRDLEACHKRARSALAPARPAPEPPRRPTVLGRPLGAWILSLAVLAAGLLLLPRLTVGGHRWFVWLLS